jgi:hypothetical protein
MKKVIAEKSKGQLVFFSFLFLFLLVLFLLLIYFTRQNLSDSSEYSFQIVSISFSLIFLLIYIFVQLRKPKILIECDDDHIYLNYNGYTETIPTTSIIQVTPKRVHYRYGNYTFGNIIIHTNVDQYKIGHVPDCEEVSLKIMRIVKEKFSQTDIEHNDFSI